MARFRTTAISAFICLTTVANVLAAPTADGKPSEVLGEHPGLQLPSLDVRREKGITSLRPYNLSNKDDGCGHAFDDGDKKVREEIWWRSTAGGLLEFFTADSQYGYRYPNWVQEMDKRTWKKKQSAEWDCATLTSQCGPPADCHEFYDVAGVRAQEFYIFYSIHKAHETFKYMKEKLQDQAIYDSLTGISELLKDFGEEPSGVNPFGIAAGAFGIASGLLGLIPGAGAIGGAATGAASGAFGVAAATYKPDKPDGKLSALVAEYFDKTSLAMEDTLKNLFGKGNQTNIPGEAQANTLWPYKTEVARFFDGGKFLINDVQSVFNGIVTKGKDLFHQALIIQILAWQGYHIHIDTSGDCTRAMHKSGMCWKLVGKPYQTSSGFMNNNFPRWGQSYIDQKKVDLMEKKYMMNLDWIFEQSFQCVKARGHQNREVDVKNIPYDGTPPLCFFNLDVYKGKFSRDGGNYVDEQPL